jgi:FAD:protein FMN transferase
VAVLDLDQQREAVDGKADSAPEEALDAAAVSAEALRIERRGDNLLAIVFTAMASPCEVLLPLTDDAAAVELGKLAAQEAWRVEKKFSRYRSDSVTAWIHEHRDAAIDVDVETASLLDFARRCFDLSDGLFDITSGPLRHAWKFDGSDRIPEAAAIQRLLPLVGFDKLQWQSPHLLLPGGMELDFGGIGKEYAVDRAYDLVAARRSTPFLINFGGDLRANRPPPHGPWQVGIERPDQDRTATMLLELEHGALATSGDSHRYLLKDGVRYGHILDPRTGWPVPNSPRSVTVAASSCTEAGLLSTLALLHGARAAEFLDEQGVRYWILQ